MKKKNSENWAFIELITGLLIGIVLMFFVFFGLTRMIPDLVTKLFMPYTVKIENKSERNDTNDSYVGEYTYSKTYQNDGVTYTAIIDLVSDGTFYTRETATMKNYYYGTYEVSGNVLKLNFQYNWANAQGSYGSMNKTIEYKIENNTIISAKNSGTESYFASRSDEDVVLTKKSSNTTLPKEFTNELINTIKMEAQLNKKEQ